MKRNALVWRTFARLFVWASLMGVGAVSAADFIGSGVGAIPDGDPAGLNVTFSVSGIAMPIKRVQLKLTLTHTYVSDLEATLTSPSGVAHLLVLGRIGTNPVPFVGSGFPSNLGGTYTFDDSGGDLWAAAGPPLTGSDTVPPGRYRTSTGGTTLSYHGGCATSLAGAFEGLSGTNTNGTWTLKIADMATGDTGSVSAVTLTVLDDSLFTDSFDAVRGTCKLAQFDFTGTGRSSYVVERNTGGGVSGTTTWFIQDNDGTLTGAQQSFIHGLASDTFVSGDFDGDGISDAAVWRPGVPGVAKFIVRRSSRPTDIPLIAIFGQNGDDPSQIGDHDGDGFDDFAVYRAGVALGNPSHTLIHLTRRGPDRNFITGENGAYASGGVDYTGDGRADMAIQSNAGAGVALFRIFDGSDGTLGNTFTFGTPTDVMVVGNHSGNGLYDITTVRGSGGTAVWTTRDAGTGNGLPSVDWGLFNDFTLSGDFDGDGLDDYAVWRPNNDPAMTIFFIRPSGNPGTPITLNFGQSGDYPVENSRSR